MNKPAKRMGKKDAPTREAFLDAAERLLRREGITSLIAKRVAEEAGQTKQLLYYYFTSMEELIREAYVRSIAEFDRELDGALKGENPLKAVWKLMTGGDGRMNGEFMALANHSESFRQAIADVSAAHYEQMSARFRDLVQRTGLDESDVSPKLLAFFLLALSRNLILERDLGLLECGADLDRFLGKLFERTA